MNKKYNYIIGDIYGIVRLIDLFKNDKNRQMAKVQCIKCSKIKIMRACDLYNSKENSCMCQNKKHGLYKSKIYSIYNNIKDRCFNSNNHAYKNYGGKGVTICKEWANDFKEFYNWSINNGYIEGLSIDRIDSNGNYEPNNCRWITLSQNVALANKQNVRRKANKGMYYGISPDGVYYKFSNASKFAREHNLNAGNIRDVANNRKKTHKKWKFGFVKK